MTAISKERHLHALRSPSNIPSSDTCSSSPGLSTLCLGLGFLGNLPGIRVIFGHGNEHSPGSPRVPSGGCAVGRGTETSVVPEGIIPE